LLDGAELRARLAGARLYLLFTPALCGERDPLEVLEAALGVVDLVQVRVPCEDGGPANARETLEWCSRVLALTAERAPHVPVLVNDRVDVACALAEAGCAGVHLGDRDCPPAEARALLGPAPLIGLSTHSAADVARATDEPVDYLGFGPVFPTATKGYEEGLGPDAAWIASAAAGRPVFPIGGIALDNADTLARAGRAAVSSAVLGAPDPARAAAAIRALLDADD
jgi:thiamine-phosphate pyrophosphorylase